ncbi:MAG TPA: helix-turn-helix domain-containing protein [Gemmatimonadaceae bacterium]|nr:helix-turn-helix domain-containing protein [Gemmatimonadaceae bacterium]
MSPKPVSAKTASQTCAAGTLRRASRAVSRMYDGHLASTGLTTTQFSLLSALARHGEPVALMTLASELVLERTSLYRALHPLARDGFVRLLGLTGRRAKKVELTGRGRQKVARALPHWQRAQNEFLEHVGNAAWNRLSAQLVDIARPERDA